MMRKSSLPAYVFIAMLCVSCSAIQFDTSPGDVLFQDDFSRESSGWDRYHDSTYSSDYFQGGYRFHILEPNTDAWANPHLSFQNVQIEVDARRLSGPEDNLYGLICRYQDPRNYYFFVVSSDGFAGIGVFKEGRRDLISGDSLLPSDAILLGEVTNHIRADCQSYWLRLYVNNVLVAEAQAAEWEEGDVGLIAGTYDNPGAEILFDNFSVLHPSE
jgi:hypothetical protein